jgi:hypothetical protein
MGSIVSVTTGPAKPARRVGKNSIFFDWQCSPAIRSSYSTVANHPEANPETHEG